MNPSCLRTHTTLQISQRAHKHYKSNNICRAVAVIADDNEASTAMEKYIRL